TRRASTGVPDATPRTRALQCARRGSAARPRRAEARDPLRHATGQREGHMAKDDTGSAVGDVQALVASEVARALVPVKAERERALVELRERTPEDRVALVVFSGDLDRVLAAFVIATGAAAAGLQTSIFFTFWGLSAIKKKGARAGGKGFKQRMF